MIPVSSLVNILPKYNETKRSASNTSSNWELHNKSAISLRKRLRLLESVASINSNFNRPVYVGKEPNLLHSGGDYFEGESPLGLLSRGQIESPSKIKLPKIFMNAESKRYTLCSEEVKNTCKLHESIWNLFDRDIDIHELINGVIVVKTLSQSAKLSRRHKSSNEFYHRLLFSKITDAAMKLSSDQTVKYFSFEPTAIGIDVQMVDNSLICIDTINESQAQYLYGDKMTGCELLAVNGERVRDIQSFQEAITRFSRGSTNITVTAISRENQGKLRMDFTYSIRASKTKRGLVTVLTSMMDDFQADHDLANQRDRITSETTLSQHNAGRRCFP